jgi:hypothetical protein
MALRHPLAGCPEPRQPQCVHARRLHPRFHNHHVHRLVQRQPVSSWTASRDLTESVLASVRHGTAPIEAYQFAAGSLRPCMEPLRTGDPRLVLQRATPTIDGVTCQHTGISAAGQHGPAALPGCRTSSAGPSAVAQDTWRCRRRTS